MGFKVQTEVDRRLLLGVLTRDNDYVTRKGDKTDPSNYRVVEPPSEAGTEMNEFTAERRRYPESKGV